MNETRQPRPSDDASGKRRTAIVLILTFGLIAGLVVAMGTGRDPVSCPDELIGAWKTTARGYEDGMLVFTKKAVVFSAGADMIAGQAVRRLEAVPDGDRTLYTVVYGGSRDDEQILSFYYHPRKQTITFKNQSHLVWTRDTVES